MSRIVGIVLVRNEDLFIAQAVRNAVGFCDSLLIVDNESSDGTGEILRDLEAEFPGKITVHRSARTGLSHDLIAGFAGSETWIFAVDGDEIYDPAGLARLRRRIDAGEFDGDWCLFGNVLNVRRIDPASGLAEGHLSPPCRSMTKLYNFRAISAWHGPCHERLHGGRVEFREGFHAGLRRQLHEAVSWEEADFRCLHTCFLRRSSLEPATPAPRKNIMDRHTWSASKVLRALVDRLTGRPAIDWKEQRYGRGPLVSKPAAPFFPAAGGRPDDTKT